MTARPLLLSAAICISAATPTLAQDIKLKMVPGTNYEIKQADGFKPYRTSDGKIKLRVLVTQHVLQIPACYKKGPSNPLLSQELKPDSITIGNLSNPLPTDNSRYTRVSGTKLTDLKPFQSIISDEVNKLIISKKYVQNNFEMEDDNDYRFRAKLDNIRNSAFDLGGNIINPTIAFTLGDFTDNRNNFVRLCIEGKKSITAIDQLEALKTAEDYLELLENPKSVADKNATKKSRLTAIDFQESGSWNINEYDVLIENALDGTGNPLKVKMYEVKITWALEATLDPEANQPLPLVEKPEIAAVDPEGSQQPATTPTAQVSSFDFSALLGLGNAAGVIAPGIEPMIGWGATDRSSGVIAGLNLRFKPTDSFGKFVKASAGNMGIFLGHSNGSNGNSFTVLAPSIDIGQNSSFFMGFKIGKAGIGGGFSDNGQGGLTQRLAFGVAVRFGIAGVADTRNDQNRPQKLQLVVTGAEPSQACYEEKLACVIFPTLHPFYEFRKTSPGFEALRTNTGRAWAVWVDKKILEQILNTPEAKNPNTKIEVWSNSKYVEDRNPAFGPGKIIRITVPIPTPAPTPGTG